MALASVEPPWLHTIGLIAGTLLMLELIVVLLVVLVLAGALAYGLWWLRAHVVPVLDQYGGQARQVMERTTQGTDRIVQGVAEFQGRKEAARTILRVLLFGEQSTGQSTTQAARQAHAGQRSQREARPARGISSIGGYAPRDLPVDAGPGTRDTSAEDLAPLTGER